jgi:hypothetical protein
MTWEPCVTCARLRKCNEVNHALLMVGGGCSLHEAVHEGVVCARLRIMDEFGARAIPTKSNLKKGIISMAASKKAVANKRYLRALARSLGVIPETEGRSAFQIPAEDLCDMILTTEDERFANIYEMSDDEVKALKEGVKSGGSKPEPKTEEGDDEEKPAPKKSATRRTRKKQEEAPPLEEEETSSDEDSSDEDSSYLIDEDSSDEDSSDEEDSSPSKRAPSKRKAPAGRRRAGRKAAPAKAESSTAAASADLSKLEDMVKTIGIAGDDRDKAIKSLGKMLEALAEKIDAIDGFLCYEYNQDQDEGNGISSLTEVDWT